MRRFLVSAHSNKILGENDHAVDGCYIRHCTGMTTVLCMVQGTGSSHLGLIISRGMVVAKRAVQPQLWASRVLMARAHQSANIQRNKNTVCCCKSDECRNGIGAAFSSLGG